MTVRKIPREELEALKKERREAEIQRRKGFPLVYGREPAPRMTKEDLARNYPEASKAEINALYKAQPKYLRRPLQRIPIHKRAVAAVKSPKTKRYIKRAYGIAKEILREVERFGEDGKPRRRRKSKKKPMKAKPRRVKTKGISPKKLALIEKILRS